MQKEMVTVYCFSNRLEWQKMHVIFLLKPSLIEKFVSLFGDKAITEYIV